MAALQLSVSPFLELVIENLGSLIQKEIGVMMGVKELKKLSNTLSTIRDVIGDAEVKQIHDKPIYDWLRKLKDLAYEADDILDECATEVKIRGPDIVKNSSCSIQVNNPSNSSCFHLKEIMSRRSIGKRIKELREKFDELSDQRIRFHLNLTLGNVDSRRKEKRETYTFLTEPQVYGREEDKKHITNLLLKGAAQQDVSVCCIVGMGGLGKTTLAQIVYNDEKIANNFEVRCWICVSEDFVLETLLKAIIESTGGNARDLEDLDPLQRRVQGIFSGKKFLLVLDDVWNEDQTKWYKLKSLLMCGGIGSSIIVTTRLESVASMTSTFPIWRLEILSEEDCWSLFKHYAFDAENEKYHPMLEEIGKQIMKKCAGLPLAAKVLGGLLRFKKTENEWLSVRDSALWDLQQDRQEDILPVLRISYNTLPSHLKQCFMSYSSFYPKGCTFYKKHMIQLWMAEGFLPQPSENDNKSMEEVGNTYFNSLLCKSFFQDVEKSIQRSDIEQEVISFKMYDLIQELAIDVAGDYESLVVEVHENMEKIPDVHRLGLMSFSDGMSKAVSKALQDKTKLRMLLVNGTIKKIENNAFDGIKRLRVLDLHEAPNIEEIPSSLLGNLKHLRYLDLSYTKITNLPESVTRLYNLQTLRLTYCVNLKELPKSIGNLINLRHLYLPNDIKMPREIGKLSSLQTVYPFKVDCNSEDKEKIGSGCGIEVLERLNLLNGELSIFQLRNVTSCIEAQRANLKGKKGLKQITLSWHTYGSATREDDCECNKDEVVLEALQPHPNLQKLVIDQYFGAKLPQWMGDLSCLPYLVHLALNNCTKCEQLVGFGKLPSLKVLRLGNMDGIKCLGNEFYDNNFGGGDVGSSSSTCEVVLFPSLKELVLSKMGSLEEWVETPPSTPKVAYSCFLYVEKIKIEGCPNLKSTPTYFPSLKKLYLKEINERVAVPLSTTNLNSLVDFQFDENLRG